MSLYFQVARKAFHRYATYRMATVAALVEITVTTTFKAYVWLAVLHARGPIRGFDADDAVTFAFFSAAMYFVLQISWDTEITTRITSGDIVTDLYRPVGLQAWWFAQEAGRTVYDVFARGVPPVVAGALLFHFALPGRPAVWLAFAASVALAFVVSTAFRFLMSCVSFWLLDARGVVSLATGVFTVTSGSMLPLAFWPGAAADVMRLLPFASILQLPIEVLLEKGSAVEHLAVQAMWAVVMVTLAQVVLHAAERRLVVQGG